MFLQWLFTCNIEELFEYLMNIKVNWLLVFSKYFKKQGCVENFYIDKILLIC